MKINRKAIPCGGITRLEIFALVITAGVLFSLFYAFIGPGSEKSKRIACAGRLMNISMGFRGSAMDHDGELLFRVSTNKGGSAEWSATDNVYPHFLTISNWISTPSILVCPSDRSRASSKANTFREVSNANISYFINLDALENGNSILAGDRNIDGASHLSNRVFLITSSSPVEWSKDMHGYQGNIARGDGSVTSCSNGNFKSFVQQSTLPMRLAIP